ncbi:CitMHS family transporter [Lysinibacter sp. HNR]|uniref:CitMHS family transporter n=1 Tax=Lysinibacter sp. HNR TaxID=3031408 RepID=UPI002435BC94|nr:CitMHS family transporter [Lysinibacter sp. HNR]WGD38605.1 CitMHS family transporter [Lysinibacter sp. HNR]
MGFTMIITFMVLIMTKKLTPMVALILVPTVFGLFVGAGMGLGEMVLEAIGRLAPTAALLMFAIIYFGLMIDVGLFDPLVRFIVKTLGHDPARVVLGTAILAAAVSLDGDGSTTFIVTTAAMLPLYIRLGMSPVVLTCVAGLANGTLNIIPWGGPTVRAAAALNVSPTDVFVPMIPSLVAGLVVMFIFAWFLGLSERKRLGSLAPFNSDQVTQEEVLSRFAGLPPFTRGDTQRLAHSNPEELSTQSVLINEDKSVMTDTMLDPSRETLRPGLIWFNLVLTLAVMGMLITDLVPLPYVFMVGSAIALVVNFPGLKQQSRAIVAHAPSVVGVVSMVLAAGVLIGVLNGTGMVAAMSSWLVTAIPDTFGPFLAVITGILSIPMTFFMSNDAFYFGMLPVLAESASSFGIAPVEMARASIIGQPVHLQSPLVPAILLLVSLANVNLGDHHRKVLWRAVVISLVMLGVGLLIGVIPLG